MDEIIRFTRSGASEAGLGTRHQVVADAMRRYVPHVVDWRYLQAGGPIWVTLPESLSARELLRRAEAARVHVAAAHDPTAPDRVFEIHYAHLGEAEIEEGIRRLGHCLVRYSELAARNTSGQPTQFIGA